MSKAIVSSLYDSEVFKMACRQFDQAADAINLPDALRDRTKQSLDRVHKLSVGFLPLAISSPKQVASHQE